MFDSKVRQNIVTPMQGEQLIAYENMRDLLFASIVNDKEMTTITVANKLVQSLRLTQISDGYVSPNPANVNWLKDNWKFRAIDEFIDEYMEDIGNKLVIWSRFVPVVKALYDRYAYRYGATYICGEVKGEERSERMYRFQEEGDCKIMVAQINSAGLGMGFQPATFEIFVDKWWSPAPNLQAEDRILGVRNPVPITVISLISQDSIDERWEYILSRKKQWADHITGDISVDIEAPPKFDRDTLLYLLAPAKDAEKFRQALEEKWR
jgi:SNF2 family DNA or RNA helicase